MAKLGQPVTERLVRKLESYGPVSDEERRFLEQSVSHVRDYRPHEDIVCEGDCPGESCIVVDGFACRYKLLAGGTRQIMAMHVPGDFCDLHSFILKRMDHNIAALGPCRIAKFPHAVIHEITVRFPRLSRALWWDSAVDGAIMREWMISMGRRSAYEQIAHLLCELLVRLRSVGLVSDDSYELPATQQELGDVFGLSTVHVNRILQELRREGLIVFKNKRVTIPDLDRLKEAAGFDPAYLYGRGSAAGAAGAG
jgi:CRP-like cAMP-binding protein